MIKFKTASEKETFKAGAILGSILKEGDIVGLEGELGAGKTVFIKGIASANGVVDYVTSPTFVIMNRYLGKLPIYHFDVYRITKPFEIFDIGFEEYLNSNGIVVIEWADLIKEVLPDEIIWIRIEKEKGETNNTCNIEGALSSEQRIIYINFAGEKYQNYEKLLALNLGKEVGKD